MTSTKTKDVADTKSEGNAAHEEQHAGQQEASGKQPVWSRTLNRIDCSIWKHDQKGGTRAVHGCYLPLVPREEEQPVEGSFYFDKNDLKDVRSLCNVAEEQIQSLEGMTDAAGED